VDSSFPDTKYQHYLARHLAASDGSHSGMIFLPDRHPATRTANPPISKNAARQYGAAKVDDESGFVRF
jgi:hypothetical protein